MDSSSGRRERANSLNGIREIRRLRRSLSNARSANTFDYEGLARWTRQRAIEAEEDIPGRIARHRAARSLSLSLEALDTERGRSRIRTPDEEARDIARGISDLLTRHRSRSHSRSSSVVTAIRALSVGAQERGRSRVRRQEDNMANNNNNAFPPLDTSMTGPNRNATSPTTSHPGSAANGNGAGPANYMATLPVGHQQDLNFLYNQIQELGALLRNNREQVDSVTRTAEEVATRAIRATEDGAELQEPDKAKMREIERELAKAKHLIDLYKHENKENTNLIAMYEDALGTATEQIRNYCSGIEERFLTQRRHYNNLLQQEKDDHLQSRLDRDHWYAQTLKVCEMVRTAFRLRTDEWCEEYTIISGLQAQVRCYRRILDMEPEEPEEELGWPYLKELPLNDQA